MRVIRKANLSRYNYYRVTGGYPDLYLVENQSEAKHLHRAMFIIGRGSNTLIVGKLSQPVIHLRFKEEISIIWSDKEQVLLQVPASMEWDKVVSYAVNNGFYGIENLSGIPGTVGAGIRQNIGAYGSQISDVVDSVLVWDRAEGSLKTLSNKQLEFSYRDSLVKKASNLVVLSVRLRLYKSGSLRFDHPRLLHYKNRITTLRGMRRLILKLRRKVLPDVRRLPNTGSFFMNPVVPRAVADVLLDEYPDMPHRVLEDDRYALKAGWLIDKAGLKGFRYKEAAVWSRNALVLVSLGDQTGFDIYNLAQIVRDRVYEKFHILLEPEVVIVGERTNEEFMAGR